jgi:muramoyltetrapeptide carboxypeptidase
MGQFTEYKLTPHDKGFKLSSVFEWLQSRIKAPILTNLPYGHVQTKVLLPVGAKVDLVQQGRDVLMAWGHLDT